MGASTPEGSGFARRLRGPLAALEFYTRIPRPSRVPFSPAHARRAGAFAPLAGGVVGGACALSFALVGLVLPIEIAALLALAAGIATTGALHEDGFADVCDAFGGGRGREETLRILKDPRCGAYAVVGLFVLLALKVVAIVALARAAGSGAVVATFLVAHALSRLAAVAATHGRRYVSPEATARSGDFAHAPSAGDLAIAGCLGLAPLVGFAAAGLPAAMLCPVPVFLATACLARWFERRIGGYTGDCLGTVQQVSEVLVYLTACAVASFR